MTSAGTSWDLVIRAQQGDRVAFGRLYDQYRDVVFRFVLCRVADRQLAEDITGETFLRALRTIKSITYQGKDIGCWFIAISRNLVLDHVKSSRYRMEVTVANMPDPDTGGTGAWSDEQRTAAHAVENLMVADLRAHLDQVLSQLTADQEECLRLRFVQGATVREAADAMGRNDGAVKAVQHRAVRRARELMESSRSPLPYRDYLT